MGADRAILVVSEDPLEPFHVAKVFKSIVDAEKPDLVIVGKQAIDDDAAQVGPMIAGVMNWPQGRNGVVVWRE